MRYLTLNEVLELYAQIMALSGGEVGIRDINALESALAQPRMTFEGRDLYPTIIEKAAALGFAPHLWRLEVVSTLHKLRSAGYLHDQLLDEVLEAFWQWPVEIIPADRALIEQALRWAKRIRDRVIYDSIYLALAERLHADFWTADVKLHRRAREAGAEFVFLLKAK